MVAAVATLEVAPGDAELVGRARAGDRWASEALYRRHAADALRLAGCLLRRRADAEDVLQDAFVTALTKLSSLQDPAAFGGWLARIVANQARSRMRRRWWLGWTRRDDDGDDLVLDSMAAPGAPAEIRAELVWLDKALAALPDKERFAWTLRYVEGWELTEVAGLCECSLATVKRRLATARTRLAAALGHDVVMSMEEDA